MLNRIVQWMSVAFVASTLALLGWTRAETIPNSALPSWPELPLIGISVITLPFALTKVVRESDVQSRRNWAFLTGLCIVLVCLTYLFTR